MSLIPPPPIPRYPDLKREEDWPTLLKCSTVMLERLRTDYAPSTDEQFQAVVHLVQTLAPRHFQNQSRRDSKLERLQRAGEEPAQVRLLILTPAGRRRSAPARRCGPR